MSGLSPRESELARFVAAGYTNREISTMLGIRRQTVKNHLAAVFRKLGVDNRVRLTLALAKKAEGDPAGINSIFVPGSISNGSPDR